MAIVTTDDRHYTDIAYAIRNMIQLGIDYGAPPDNFDATQFYTPSGMENGIVEAAQCCIIGGILSGIEQGKREEYNAFWDAFQKRGDAAGVDYQYAFAGSDRFTDENYNPKYDIICGPASLSAFSMFYTNKSITNTKVPIRVLVGQMGMCFYNCTNLHTIPLLEVQADTSFISVFNNCGKLENLTMAGTIGKNIDLSPCPKLSRASIESVINTLSDTVSKQTVTFSSVAVDNAFETSEGLCDGIISPEWAELIATKSNWTISLV